MMDDDVDVDVDIDLDITMCTKCKLIQPVS